MPRLRFKNCDYDCKRRETKRGFRVYCRKTDKKCQPIPKSKNELNPKMVEEAQKFESGYAFEKMAIKYWEDIGHTQPIATSLAMLSVTGVLEKVEGLSKGQSVYPFYVQIKDPTKKIMFITKSPMLKEVAMKYGMDLRKFWRIANPGREEKIEIVGAGQLHPVFQKPPKIYVGTKHEFREFKGKWTYGREYITQPLTQTEIERILVGLDKKSKEYKLYKRILVTIKKEMVKYAIPN